MNGYNFDTNIKDVMTEDEMEGLMNERLEEQCEEEYQEHICEMIEMTGTLMVNFVYWKTGYDEDGSEWGIPENEVEYFFSLPTETQVTLLNKHDKYGYPVVILAPACNI